MSSGFVGPNGQWVSGADTPAGAISTKMLGEWLTPGTYTIDIPQGTPMIWVDGAAGGGGGGAGFASGASGGGGGGGAAGDSCRMFPIRVPPTTTRLRLTIGAAGTGGVVGGAAAGQGGDTKIEDPDASNPGGWSVALLTLWGTSGTVAQPGTANNGGNGGGKGNPIYQNGGAGGASAAGTAPGAIGSSRSMCYWNGYAGAGGGGSNGTNGFAGAQTPFLQDWQPQPNPGALSGALGGGGAGALSIWSGVWLGKQGVNPGAGGAAPVPFGNDVPGAGGGGGGCNGAGNPGGAGMLRIFV